MLAGGAGQGIRRTPNGGRRARLHRLSPIPKGDRHEPHPALPGRPGRAGAGAGSPGLGGAAAADHPARPGAWPEPSHGGHHGSHPPGHLIRRVTVILAGLTGSLPAISGPGPAVGGRCPLNKTPTTWRGESDGFRTKAVGVVHRIDRGKCAVGGDGALYVTETAAGKITRVDPQTGATTTYASGLPKSIIGLGGATDIAFLGHTAY